MESDLTVPAASRAQLDALDAAVACKIAAPASLLLACDPVASLPSLDAPPSIGLPVGLGALDRRDAQTNRLIEQLKRCMS